MRAVHEGREPVRGDAGGLQRLIVPVAGLEVAQAGRVLVDGDDVGLDGDGAEDDGEEELLGGRARGLDAAGEVLGGRLDGCEDLL